MPEKLTVARTSEGFRIKRLSPEGRGKGIIETRAFPTMKAAMDEVRRRRKSKAERMFGGK